MKKEVMVKPEPAPLNKRVFAYVLDWYVGSAVSAIPAGILWNMSTGEAAVNTVLAAFESPYGLLAGILGILAGALYFYLIPLCVWKGQTLGKKLLGSRIARENGEMLSAGELAPRQICGVMLLEATFIMTGDFLIQMDSMPILPIAGRMLSYVIFAAFAISVCMVWKNKTAIHDVWVHSTVIEMKKD